MNNAVTIIETIKKRYKYGETYLIAIDGFGGSGKSTLAKKIKESFPNTTIVQIDDFYSHKLKRAHRQRVFEQVLKPLKEGKPARYQIYDWKNKRLGEWVDVSPGGVIIIEGVSAMHPDFGKYNLTVWVDYPQEEAAQKGIARDLSEYKVDTTEQWRNEWMPQEKDYVEKHKPQESADIIVNYED